jgi:hypothetical protein
MVSHRVGVHSLPHGHVCPGEQMGAIRRPSVHTATSPAAISKAGCLYNGGSGKGIDLWSLLRCFDQGGQAWKQVHAAPESQGSGGDQDDIQV